MLKDTPNATESFPLSSQLSNEQVMCSSGQQCEDIILDCGKPVNFTYYDNLLGVANRDKHPLVPEPNVALMFKKNGGKTMDVDIDLLEKRLMKAKREVRLLQNTLFINKQIGRPSAKLYIYIYILYSICCRNQNLSNFTIK